MHFLHIEKCPFLTHPPVVKKTNNQVAGFLIVFLTMVEMFSIPRSFFVLGSIVATSAMMLTAFLLLEEGRALLRTSVKHLLFAAMTAAILYFIFLAGNLGIRTFPLFGMSSASEQSIYGLFRGIPIELLVLVLLLDAVGFETYFRGNLVRIFREKIGIASVFLVAAIDAVIHLATFNPLFSATTFVADSIWGLYFFKTRDLSSTIACHFIWDILIFIVVPIR
jgi:membrane protease YdiL (CAAX protease family)